MADADKIRIGIAAHRESANLDFLRSVAVLFVVISHLAPAMGAQTFLLHGHRYRWQALGMLGVMMFFVHTCLVLMMSLVRQREKYGARFFHTAFFTRRFFRIYPLSVAAVCLSFGLAAAGLAAAAPFTFKGFASNLMLVQNITGAEAVPGVLWSLPYEIQMYLVLPALFLLVRSSPKRAPWIVAALWLASVFEILGIVLSRGDYHLVGFIPSFLPGLLAFTLLGAPRRLPFWVLPALLAPFAVIYPILVQATGEPTLLSWPLCLALGILLPHLTEIRQVWLRRGSKTIAKYSYGIYLTHTWAVWFATSRLAGLPRPTQFVAFVGIASALAWLAYRLIEGPGIRLGNHLIERWIAKGKSAAREMALVEPAP